MERKADIHKGICDELNATYRAKNADYGDSFARVRREEGDAVILVRLKDKLYRLETLLHGADRKVDDESIDDTILDLANYCIMELVEKRYDAVQKTVKELMTCEVCGGDIIRHAEHFWEKEKKHD